MGRATRTESEPKSEQRDFNPHPPWGGRRRCLRCLSLSRKISIHTLRGEGDSRARRLKTQAQTFQSTPSVGRATSNQKHGTQREPISIHTLRGEGDERDYQQAARGAGAISIHTLRGEGDDELHLNANNHLISIHTLRGEGDITNFFIYTIILLFQSTPSVGRATDTAGEKPVDKVDFNPHPPWGGRLFLGRLVP